MELIEIDFHTREVMFALVVAGLLAFAGVQRWPRSLAVWLAVSAALTITLAGRILGLLHANMTPEFTRLVVREVFLGSTAVLVGIALPVLAFLRSRSRPAA
jgi:hypothetical protein